MRTHDGRWKPNGRPPMHAPQASFYSPCTVLAALCQRSLAFTHRSPTSLQPFCRPKRSSTDQVQILYSPVRGGGGYKKEISLSHSSLAHMSSADMEQTEELVEVDPECMWAVLQNEVDKNYLAMYLYMNERNNECTKQRKCGTKKVVSHFRCAVFLSFGVMISSIGPFTSALA